MLENSKHASRMVDLTGFVLQLKTIDLEGKWDRASMSIKDKDDELLVRAFNGNPVE